MNYELPNDWPLPAEYLTELGRISVLFSALESAVNLSISKLSGYDGVLDWRSAVVTAHANFKQRVDILETLCHELHDENPSLATYREVMKKIKLVQSERNRFLHNQLYFDSEVREVHASSISARGELKPRVEKISLNDLRKLSAQTHLAMLGLHALITQVKYPPVWETHPHGAD